MQITSYHTITFNLEKRDRWSSKAISISFRTKLYINNIKNHVDEKCSNFETKKIELLLYLRVIIV